MVVVGAGGGGVFVAAFAPLGVRTVGEELEEGAPQDETELRVGRLLLLVQRAADSLLMPKLKVVVGLASFRQTFFVRRCSFSCCRLAL